MEETSVKKDVLAWANGILTEKRPSKETLNHSELIQRVTGLDPYQDTAQAFLQAYKVLGIDLVNRVPLENAPLPAPVGKTVAAGENYRRSYLGVYDTYCRIRYPFQDEEDFFQADPNLEDAELITPVPHPVDYADILRREQALGEIGSYYCMQYTTLFMWAVEYLGWEVFLTAAALEPEQFDAKFLKKAARQTEKAIEILCRTENPFVWLHDDLASAKGPMLQPEWYQRYIFPYYAEFFAKIHTYGKKVIFVADGNMEYFLPFLRELGVDGVMLENPATPFEKILQYFGDRIVIGGMETEILRNCTPDEVYRATTELCETTKEIPGFAISCVGGLHGGLPLENLLAYFSCRKEYHF